MGKTFFDVVTRKVYRWIYFRPIIPTWILRFEDALELEARKKIVITQGPRSIGQDGILTAPARIIWARHEDMWLGWHIEKPGPDLEFVFPEAPQYEAHKPRDLSHTIDFPWAYKIPVGYTFYCREWSTGFRCAQLSEQGRCLHFDADLEKERVAGFTLPRRCKACLRLGFDDYLDLRWGEQGHHRRIRAPQEAIDDLRAGKSIVLLSRFGLAYPDELVFVGPVSARVQDASPSRGLSYDWEGFYPVKGYGRLPKLDENTDVWCTALNPVK